VSVIVYCVPGSSPSQLTVGLLFVAVFVAVSPAGTGLIVIGNDHVDAPVASFVTVARANVSFVARHRNSSACASATCEVIISPFTVEMTAGGPCCTPFSLYLTQMRLTPCQPVGGASSLTVTLPTATSTETGVAGSMSPAGAVVVMSGVVSGPVLSVTRKW